MDSVIVLTQKKMKKNASSELAKGMKKKTIPPFVGIRVKSFTNELIKEV